MKSSTDPPTRPEAASRSRRAGCTPGAEIPSLRTGPPRPQPTSYLAPVEPNNPRVRRISPPRAAPVTLPAHKALPGPGASPPAGSFTLAAVRASLPGRAEEVDQDRGDDLGRGVVIVSVEHHEPRARRGGGLLGHRALEPAGAVLAAQDEDGCG